jgi:hypothetical protein
MNRFRNLFILLVLVLASASLLSACDFSTANIKGAEMGTGFDSGSKTVTGATNTFELAAPEIHTVVSVANAPSDTSVRAVLTAVDVTDMNGVQATDTQITENSFTLASDGVVDFKWTVPPTGEWPVGSYKVDLYLNDKLDRTLNFTVQ